MTADKLDKISSPANTQLERDNTGWLHLTKLPADTKLFYEVLTEGATRGPGGSFRTLPDTPRRSASRC